MMEVFAKITMSKKLRLDVRLGSEYDSGYYGLRNQFQGFFDSFCTSVFFYFSAS